MNDEPTDRELIAAVAEGDRGAFDRLYDRHAAWLLLLVLASIDPVRRRLALRLPGRAP